VFRLDFMADADNLRKRIADGTCPPDTAIPRW
jgi:hypothetical protein